MPHAQDDDAPHAELRDRVGAQVPNEVRDLQDRLDILAELHRSNPEVLAAIGGLRVGCDDLTLALIRAEFGAQRDRRRGHR